MTKISYEERINLYYDRKNGMMEYGYSMYGSEVILKKSEYTGKINISSSENKEYKYDLIVNEEVKKALYFKVLINNLKDIVTGNIRKK